MQRAMAAMAIEGFALLFVAFGTPGRAMAQDAATTYATVMVLTRHGYEIAVKCQASG